MRELAGWTRRLGVVATIAACTCAISARAQSAADLSARLVIDGDLRDFTARESVFRDSALCAQLLPPPVCPQPEERADDSSAGTTRELRQLFVTWDARALYLGVEASLDGMALLAVIDVRGGGLTDLVSLPVWRRGVRFGDAVRPDFLIACSDDSRSVELWRASGSAAVERVEAGAFTAAARFGDRGRGVEIAIPWSVVFPGAPLALDPEPGAPPGPMFVLPQDASRAGLRFAALVTDTRDGFGAFDVAPDPREGVALDPRSPVDIDRAARIAWDENVTAAAPAFVDFAAAVQTQSAARFVPEAPAGAIPLSVRELQTFDTGRPSALLLGDAGRVLEFRFAVGPPDPVQLYVTARVLSLRGERVRELYRDSRRTAGGDGTFVDRALDVWDGRDGHGRPVPGGVYVLQLRAASSPGGNDTVLQHAITVVR